MKEDAKSLGSLLLLVFPASQGETSGIYLHPTPPPQCTEVPLPPLVLALADVSSRARKQRKKGETALSEEHGVVYVGWIEGTTRPFPVHIPTTPLSPSSSPSLPILIHKLWHQNLPRNECVVETFLPEVIADRLPQLSKEYMAMQKSPPPFVWAAPDEKNILLCTSYLIGSLDPLADDVV